MRTAFTYCMGLAVTAAAMLACADTAKPLPELPLTVESIEAFADPGDVELLNSTSYYSRASKDYVYQKSTIMEDYKPIFIEEGLESWFRPGLVVKLRDRISSVEWTIEHEAVPGPISPTWTQDGMIYYENFREVTREDVERINQFSQLSILEITSTVEHPFDIGWFNSNLPLSAFHIHASAIVSPSSICRYPEMQFIRYVSSGLRGEFNTSECSTELKTLFVTHSDVESLIVSQLPTLGTLNLIGSAIEQVQIDGESLPSLKSIFLEEVNFPSDLSRVQLPRDLVQLLMPRVTDNDLSQLDLPEHLQYLDLSEAQLDDFGFILGAKNLRHLSLDFSNFTQWHLLPQLTELQHLSISGTDFTNDDLAYLAEMGSLQTLNLGGVPITTVLPLKELTGLSGLNLYMTNITDFNEIPFIENVSYLGLPDTVLTELPEHISQMQETASDDYFHCNELKPCTQPAWE